MFNPITSLYHRIFRKIYDLNMYGDTRVIKYRYKTRLVVVIRGIEYGPYEVNKGDWVIVPIDSEIIEEV